MSATLLSGFLLGLLSSLHCVGMCGPLLLALPTRQLPRVGRTLAPLMYHAGRIAVYALGGLLFGLLGRHVYLAGWQRLFSIAIGVAILVIYVARRWSMLPSMKISLSLSNTVSRFWRSPSTTGFFILGIANGLLPCGMVYLAIAAALTRNTIGEATLFMVLFGVGTLPLLTGLQVLGRTVGAPLRSRLRRTLPLVTVLMAVLLILRGLNLGIPFVSPRLATAPQVAISCH